MPGDHTPLHAQRVETPYGTHRGEISHTHHVGLARSGPRRPPSFSLSVSLWWSGAVPAARLNRVLLLRVLGLRLALFSPLHVLIRSVLFADERERRRRDVDIVPPLQLRGVAGPHLEEGVEDGEQC